MGDKVPIKIIETSLDKLKHMKSYNTKHAAMELKNLLDCYCDHKMYWTEMADTLVKGNAADTFVKILKEMKKIGYIKNDLVWSPTYYVLKNSWNFSDASLSFSTALGNAGMIKVCADILDNTQYRQKLDKDVNNLYICRSSLSILYNLSRCILLKHYFRQEKIIKKIKVYIECDPLLKALTIMIIAAIVEEEENAILQDTGTVGYLIFMCEQAIKSADRRYDGFSVKGLMCGIGRLAVNKDNCQVIIDYDGLQTIQKVLSYHDTDEQVEATKAVWNLAFNETHGRPDIKANKDILDCLEKLTQSENKAVETNARGALWTIEGNIERGKRDTSVTASDKPTQHVMISYQWDAQKLVIQIKDALKNCGYNVWLDLERMKGSTLQAMAEAVENSTKVIICITERYKYSPNCRLEAEYAMQRRKDIVPLMLQSEYKPDGWLGIILGVKLYTEFRGQYIFQDQINMLTKEIGPTFGEPVTAGIDDVSEKSMVKTWTTSNVKQWLEDIGLTRYCDKFANFEGPALVRLSHLRAEAPEFFYSVLRNDFGLKIEDLLKFTEALERI